MTRTLLSSPVHSRDRWNLLAVVLATALVLAAVAQRAWVTEDAYITFRTLDNFLNGHGLTWNTDQRVQAFTHPLWLLLHIPIVAVTREVFFTTIVVSTLCSVGAFVVLTKGSRSPWLPFALALPLVGSRAFCDYATSGLENPLSFLLLAAFLREAAGAARPGRLGLLAALAATNRLDCALIYTPALLAVLWQRRDLATLKSLLLAGWPLALWEAFSLLYYGTLLPNTYYAKLTTGVSAAAYMDQGLVYLTDLCSRDPASVAVLVGGLGAAGWQGFTQRSRGHDQGGPDGRRGLTGFLAVGIGLYGLYVIRVGGDFMAGRFFALPVFGAAALLFEALRAGGPRVADEPTSGWVGALAVAAVAWTFPRTEFFALPAKLPPNGIADERFAYFDTNTLATYVRGKGPASHRAARDGLVAQREGAKAREAGHTFVIQTITIGMLGYYAGPDVHIVDSGGLSEPLLSRIPIEDTTKWRIGHYARYVPRGYLHYRSTGSTAEMDSDLAAYVEHTRPILSGPLFSSSRLSAIVAWNLGSYDALLASHVARRQAAHDAKPKVPSEEEARGADSIKVGGAAVYGAVSGSPGGAVPAGPAVAPGGGGDKTGPYKLADAATPRTDNTPWNAPGTFKIPVGGSIEFQAAPPVRGTEIQISADGNDLYTLQLHVGADLVATVTVPKDARGPGLITRTVPIPDTGQGEQIDRIVVSGEGDPALSVGHILFR